MKVANAPADLAEQVARQDAHNRMVRRLVRRLVETSRIQKGWKDTQVYATRMPKHLADAGKGYLENTGGCGMCVIEGGFRMGNPDLVLVGETFGDTAHLLDHVVGGYMPLNIWRYATWLVNPSGHRAYVPELYEADLSAYLLNSLLVGAVTRKGGRTPFGTTNHITIGA